MSIPRNFSQLADNFDGTNLSLSGTATATKLIPTGTSVTGNGMYLPATNSVGISTAGTNAVYIDASQNVGIGTTSPQSCLQVAGALGTAPTGAGVHMGITSTFASIQLNGDASTGSIIDFSTSGTDYLGRILYNNASNYFTFSTNNIERMRIDSSGNVGIGTSSPVAAAKMTVQGGGANGTGGIRLLSDNIYSNGANYVAYGRRSDGNSSGGFAPGVLLARVNSAPAAITSGINLGRVAFGGSYDGTDANVVYGAQIAGYSSGTYSSTSAATDLVFFTTPSGTAGGTTTGTANFGTERMRIDSSGNLLVGTDTTSNTNGVVITKGGAAGGGIIQLYKTASGSTNGTLNYYGTTYVGGINYDNTSTSLATSSDIRLKKDVIDAPSAINVTTSIRVVSHGWKHDEATVRYGFVAQELINVAPEAVMQGDDGEEIEKTWTVDYARLVPMLVKTIQEQQALITTLTARIEALEAK